ncbi:MAG: HAD family hydrolase [SAR324 cluster bacterium]|nr:HAD family hydrolase [SAR324 cluster bacterium]
MKEPKLILLDFDGVIIESVGIKDEAFRNLFLEYQDHFEEIWSYHLAHNATIRFKKFRHIAENILHIEYTSELERQWCDQFAKTISEKMAICPFVDGALAFLDYWVKKTPIYLISISPAEELNQLLQKRSIGHYFKEIYADPWKKIDAFQDILKKEQKTFADALFIGDTPEDYESAQKINIPFIGRQSLKEFQPEVLFFKDMTEIQKHIVQYINSKRRI